MANNLIRSVLENRCKQVLINDTFRDYRTLKFGVSQRTDLGLLIFIVYINDLIKQKCDVYIFYFADDTTI